MEGLWRFVPTLQCRLQGTLQSDSKALFVLLLEAQKAHTLPSLCFDPHSSHLGLTDMVSSPEGDGVGPFVHVQSRTHAVPRAMAVVEAHGPQGSPGQGIQGKAMRALREYGLIQRYVPLHSTQGVARAVLD